MDFVRDQSLALYLPLYRMDGSAFMSGDAYGRPCSAGGSQWRNGSRYFDGENDCIVVPDDPSLRVSGGLTVEAWFRPASVNKHHVLLSKGADIAYNFRVRDNNRIQFYITQSDSGSKEVTTEATVSRDTWLHLAGTGSPLRIYINGTLSREGEAYTDIQTTLADLCVGSRVDNWGAGFSHGDIGEVRIYNRKLTPAEIERNYLAAKWRYL
jgi:hypothetical protein